MSAMFYGDRDTGLHSTLKEWLLWLQNISAIVLRHEIQDGGNLTRRIKSLAFLSSK